MINPNRYLPEGYAPFEYSKYERELSYRFREEYQKYSEFIQWGRRNPVFFAEEIFGIEFMDYQRYIFMMSWNTPYVVWCCSRNSGKSIMGSIFIMTKTLLIPNHTSYIICDVGGQSIEMFTKIEKFVYKQIPSFLTLTDYYQNELVKSASNNNGFVHNPASHHFELFNGSSVYTLNGNYDHNRSRRSNLNFYDEAAFVGNEELFTTSEPFCAQDSNFGLGHNISDREKQSQPLPFKNQLIYASSAGRTDQYFFKKYREASIRMDAGDKRYFCADINSDMVVNATKYGVVLPTPLLTQETINARMREDKEAGLREYGNIFTSEGGDGQIIRRASIMRNSYPYVPVLKSNGTGKLYCIAYDPARLHDNSVIAVGELYKKNDIWNMNIVNVVSLADSMKKHKTPMNTPNQIKELKRIIADYVPYEDFNYDSLVSILVDAGSGGAGVPITDFLCEDWRDYQGNKRKGLIDPVYNEGDDRKFPDAVKDKLQLVSPAKYKSELFEALIKMVDTDSIHFTEEYMNKGYVELIYETDGKKYKKQRTRYPSETEEEELSKKGIQVITETHYLTREEELALKQIDMAKTELVNIYRFKQSNGKDRFDLAPEKVNKMNDDRAYVIALLAYQLAQLQRENITNPEKPKIDPKKFFKIRPPKKVTLYS